MRDPLDLRDDAILEALLAEMRENAPVRVDVVDRVMARIAFSGPVVSADVGLGQLARWAAAAAAAGVGLVSAFAAKGPSIPQLVEGMGRTTVEGTSLAVKTGGTMTTIAAALAKSGMVLYEAGRATVTSVTPVQAALAAVVTASVVIMLGITTFVVGRDLRRGENA